MFAIPDWPAWAFRTFVALGGAASVLAAVKQQTEDKTDTSTVKGDKAKPFKSFQRSYLLVYYVIMLADWLQGTNMYTLYLSYKVNIGALFITGFSSSAVFGTFLGLYVDKMGRKKGCLIYCVLEVIINLLEHIPNFWLLAASRVLGGVSTSLLFSVFESWMVSEHRKRGFPEEWLTDTFGLASVGNGICAIIAGLLAQVAADYAGEIGPFQLAIALTILAFFLMLGWEENYGGDDADANKSGDAKGLTTWSCIRGDPRVALNGLVNSLFEGGMYTFVFMWVPTLLRILGDSPLPTGLVFSSFMVCITSGGLLFSMALRVATVETCVVVILLMCALSLLIPVFFTSLTPVFISFLLFEVGVGAYFPCGGTMRSKVVPDALQVSIGNVFRFPLNILVVTGTWLSDHYPAPTVFSICSGWMLTAAVLQIIMLKMDAVPKAKEN